MLVSLVATPSDSIENATAVETFQVVNLIIFLLHFNYLDKMFWTKCSKLFRLDSVSLSAVLKADAHSKCMKKTMHSNDNSNKVNKKPFLCKNWSDLNCNHE